MTFLRAVATNPSAGGRREAHGCVFQGRKTREVTTNIYSRKTSEKPKCGLRTLSVKGLGVVFTHGEGISTPRVRHKGQQPLIKYAIS